MMYSILKQIFSEYGCQDIISDSGYNFYESRNREYFVTIEYSIEELKGFFEADKTDKLLEYFEEAQSERNDIKKNTTLYIYVETDNIESFFNENKNIIFKIEEDQYYFRKHIIVYTKEGISSIKDKKNISSQLNTLLMKENRINNFIQNYYEDEEYFIATQLVAKIPFLVIHHNQIPYELLSEKVNEEKEIVKLIEFTDWYSNKGNVNYMEKLEKEILSESNDQEYLQEFFRKYEDIIKLK